LQRNYFNIVTDDDPIGVENVLKFVYVNTLICNKLLAIDTRLGS